MQLWPGREGPTESRIGIRVGTAKKKKKEAASKKEMGKKSGKRKSHGRGEEGVLLHWKLDSRMNKGSGSEWPDLYTYNRSRALVCTDQSGP